LPVASWKCSSSGSISGGLSPRACAVETSRSPSEPSGDGALIGSSLTISGNAAFHYDEALNANSTTAAIGNYAFASWFEDTR